MRYMVVKDHEDLMRRPHLPSALAAALIGAALVSAGPATADRSCPPGLAAKHNGCLPPGQAKKYRSYGDQRRPTDDVRRYYDERHRYFDDRHRYSYDHHWRSGDRIGGYDYIILRDYHRYRLPPPNGAVYVAIGNQLVRVDPNTLKVIGIVGLLSDLLN